MDTIKLLLAHSDRPLTNRIEIAVLDLCYDQAVVRSTRTARLDEAIRQGSVWDYDLLVLGADHLFTDRTQQGWATLDQIAEGLRTIRSQSSVPIVALSSHPESEMLVEAGANCVLELPFSPEELKAEVRPLLDLSGAGESLGSNHLPGLSSLVRGFQKAKAGVE